MKLKSTDFNHEEMIPSRFTCDGEDSSPHLVWNEIPEETKSFALIMDDPDAPIGTWVHWLLCDILPDTREILQNSVPPGARQVINDFGKQEYGGPCPPSGVHRYFFKLYALNKEKLDAVDKKAFYREVEAHKIDEAVIMGKYSRR